MTMLNNKFEGWTEYAVLADKTLTKIEFVGSLSLLQLKLIVLQATKRY